jgi:hypothetical protein
MDFPYNIDAKFAIDYVFDNFIIGDIQTVRTVRTGVGVFKVNTNSDRYILFKNKGVKCPDCDFVATYARLTVTGPDRAHFNFYGLNKHGKEVMLTKDHIIPSSVSTGNKLLKRFLNSQRNYQPMCEKCNKKKER